MSRPMVLLLTAAALLVLSGCGIYQVVTLDAPLSVPADSSSGTFTIRVIDAVASDAFRGFELFYKFYDPSDSITGGDDNLTTLSQLNARSFRRVSSVDDTTDDIDRPLIVIPSGDRNPASPPGPYDLVVDFGGIDSSTEPVIVPPGTGVLPFDIQPVTIRRGIAENRTSEDENLFKPFIAFSGLDADITWDPDIWAEAGAGELQVLLLLYVLSYGKDETFQDVYSVPVFLGYILVRLPVGS